MAASSSGSLSWKTGARSMSRFGSSSIGVMSASGLTTSGKSLTLVIVTMKVSLTVFIPEEAVTVILAVPYCWSWKSRVSVLPVTVVVTSELLEFVEIGRESWR